MKVGFTMDFRNVANEPWGPFWQDRLWLFEQAEAMGFDYLMVQEHYFTADAYAPSVPIFLTALIERTKSVRLGSYTYVLPLHNAIALAQETAVLDQLSGGRLDVCVGSGHRASEYRAFGMNPKTRPSRMEEGLEVLKLAWTERPFTFTGKYYDVEDCYVAPEPAQAPHPPLWVAATAPAAAARAGRHGANLHGASIDAEFFAAYFEGLDQAGVDRSSVRVSTPTSITVTSEDPAKVWDRNRDLYFERWDFYRQIRVEMGDPDLQLVEVPGADTYRDFELIGDADTVLSTLKPLFDNFPLTDLVHSGPAGGIDIRGEAYDSLKAFAEGVLPTLKTW